MAAETIREYLVALGFKIDANSFTKFDSAVLKTLAPVLKLGAAATGAATAIELMVEKVAKQMEDLYYASQRTYATADSLRQVGFAAKQVGLAAGQGMDLLEGLGKAMRMNPGVEGVIRAFQVQTRTANGHLRDTREILDDLLPKLAAMPRFQALRYAGILGMDPEALNQVLNNIPAWIQGQKDAAQSLKDFGVDQAQVSKDSVEFQRHLNALEQSFENLGIRIAHDWEKPAEAMIDQVNQLVVDFGSLNNRTDGWLGRLASLAAALGGIAATIKLIRGLLGLNAAKAAANVAAGGAGGAAAAEGEAAGVAAGGSLFSRLGPIGAFLYTLRPYATNAGESTYIEAHPEKYGAAKGFDAHSFASVVDYFEKAGLSHDQAVGVATNLQAESGLNPTAVGDNGKAFGLAQWHPDRQKAFEQMFGHSIKTSSFGEQLQFVAQELATSQRRTLSMLKHAGSAKEAAEIFSKYYERPAGGEAEAARRGAMAITLNQKTEIHVSGSKDVGKTVASEQDRVNGDLVRNLGSVVR